MPTFDGGLGQPATIAELIIPDDTNNLENPPRAIYVGGAGNITVIMLGDRTDTQVTFVGATAGSVLAVRPKRILSSGTTATSILGLR